MSDVADESRAGRPEPAISLPADLHRRLLALRRLVWRIKLAEAVCGAVCGIVVGSLVVFALDRMAETPAWGRWATFLAALAGCAAVPLAVHRWIWNHRTLEQLARLVARRFPAFGDQLLGIVEIVRSESAGTGGGDRSRRLCEAAISQVAGQATRYDLTQAVPRPRHRLWATAAVVPILLAVAAAAVVPAAAANAWGRFLMPWRAIDRFTFARLAPLADRIVVPRGEEAGLAIPLAADTLQKPATATLRIGRQKPLASSRADDGYAFTLPPQLDDSLARLTVGDARRSVAIVPRPRPGIVAVAADVTLPDYLQRSAARREDVRGGVLSPVQGSRVAFELTADRPLAASTVDGTEVPTSGTTIRTPPREFAAETRVTIGWRDTDGLEQAAALEILVAPRPDEPPSLSLQDAPPNREMLLVSDTLRFKVAVRDDFGIARVGLEWQGEEPKDGPRPATKGDRLLQTGGSAETAVDVTATFCPADLGIAPQPIVLRAFAEDALPGRGRVYSTPILLYVVDAAEHALVINERLGRWRQQAGEVRDREMGLLATNKELRKLPAEQLLDAKNRSRLEQQAAAEEAQARRMDKLVSDGARLVREAMKNTEFDAATLEDLAGDIQTLADIADARMPGVAELLKAAARARTATAAPMAAGQPAGKPADSKPEDTAAASKPGQPKPGEAAPPKVGEDRQSAGSSASADGGKPKPPVPQVVDRESSQQPADPRQQEDKPGGGGPGRLGLPTTNAGVTPPKKPRDDADTEKPAADAVAAAVAAQEALLEQFAKVADELAGVMARLEGTTFVKRLKLASREQAAIGGRIAGTGWPQPTAGVDEPSPGRAADFGPVVTANTREAEKVSHLMDDLQAYFDRRHLPAFRTVLEELKDLDALGSLRQLSEDISKEPGLSIAQTEFWSDTFDRLADDLVTPPKDDEGGSSGSGKSRPSLPPEVVLEAMRILEAEMNLREETRIAEQTRQGRSSDEHAASARALAADQQELASRVAAMAERLADDPGPGELPIGKNLPLFGPLPIFDGRSEFAPEIELFDAVEEVMQEAAGILASTHTGSRAIAAETEAIELLLASKSCNCGGGGGGGGGGGMSPGGGGTGTTRTPALALIGRGMKDKGAGDAVEEGQATGTSGRVLPEEFRAGLDAYFNRLEQERP